MDETVACGLTPEEPRVKWDIMETWDFLASDSVLLMQQMCSRCAVCSSCANQFTCWGSLTVPAMGQTGAGTPRYSAVQVESSPILAWHDHMLPSEMLWSVWESWPKSSLHVSCGSWPSEDCRVRVRQACPLTDKKKKYL